MNLISISLPQRICPFSLRHCKSPCWRLQFTQHSQRHPKLATAARWKSSFIFLQCTHPWVPKYPPAQAPALGNEWILSKEQGHTVLNNCSLPQEQTQELASNWAPPLLKCVFRLSKFTPGMKSLIRSLHYTRLTFSRLNSPQAFVSISLEEKGDKLTFIQWIQKETDGMIPHFRITQLDFMQTNSRTSSRSKLLNHLWRWKMTASPGCTP